jgi:hypothetical protein
MKNLWIVALLMFALNAKAQEITGYEYWFDDEYNSRIYTQVTPETVAEINIDELATSDLNFGWHRVYFRTKDTFGNWSSVVYRNFIQPNSVSPNQMYQIRYWTDQNSGVGVPADLTYISFTNPQGVAIETLLLDFCDLDSVGPQTVFFQLQDNRGFWSSVVSRNIVVDAISEPNAPVVEDDNGVLTSSSAFGNQWYDENGIIEGATDSTFTPETSGTYYTIVSNSCGSAQSNEIMVVITNINSYNKTENLEIFPNPTSDIFWINFINSDSKTVIYLIYDIQGSVVANGTLQPGINQISNEFSAGMYFLHAEIEEKQIRQKFIKR